MSDVTRSPVRSREFRERGQRAPQKSFRLSPDALKQLDFIIKATGKTKTQSVEQAIGFLYDGLVARLRLESERS